MPIALTTTVVAELGHNTSANPAYNKTNMPANFTGISWSNTSGTIFTVDSTKYDDSLNPVSPAHVSPVSVKTLTPNFAGLWQAHIQPWWHAGGGGGHTNVGIDLSSPAQVAKMAADAQGRDFGSFSIDWYGPSRYEDTVTLAIKAQVATMANFTYAIMVDAQVYNTTADLQALFTYANATYFNSANYQKIGGKSVVQFFNSKSVDYAAVHASYPNTYFLMQGPGQLGNAYCDGVFDWVQPYGSGVPFGDPYNAAASNSFLTSTHSTAKGVMPCIAAGFNGYVTGVAEAGYKKGYLLPRDNGKCWISQAAVVNANIPNNCIGILVPWNDYEEGSEIELGIDNGITVLPTITPSLVSGILSWTISGGDESTISSYRIMATPDGVGAGIIGVQATGGSNSINLNTVPGMDIPYTVYVIAVGIASVRNKTGAPIVFTPSGGSGSPPIIVGGLGGVGVPAVAARRVAPGITPLIHRDLLPRDLDPTKDVGLAELNSRLKEVYQRVNVLTGFHGPIPLVNDVNLNGNKIKSLGAAVDSTDALSTTAADPMYSSAVQKKAMEAVGSQMLQTTRRLNDPTQQHKISSDLNLQGSIPPTVVGTFGYTATANSITWAWSNLVVGFGDQSQIAVTDGLLLVTGLASAQYLFYPYFDTTLGAVTFVADSVSAVGSPPVAFALANANAALAQNQDGRIQLSIGAVKATATSGGSGGGLGGSQCIRSGMVIESQERGVISIEAVYIGDMIRARRGWTRVAARRIGSAAIFIRIRLVNGDAVDVTPTHPICLHSGGQKDAGDLSLSDVLCGAENLALQITQLSVVNESSPVVLLTCEPTHEYLVGAIQPTLVAHNYLSTK